MVEMLLQSPPLLLRQHPRGDVGGDAPEPAERPGFIAQDVPLDSSSTGVPSGSRIELSTAFAARRSSKALRQSQESPCEQRKSAMSRPLTSLGFNPIRRRTTGLEYVQTPFSSVSHTQADISSTSRR